MIFISGIHGVGKTYFCDMIRNELAINTYSASELISKRKKLNFSNDKRVSNIDDNQSFLIEAIREINSSEGIFALDGHFCLLNEEGEVTRIPSNTFRALNPEAIILLTENPQVISARRKERDNEDVSAQSIEFFQNEERKYAVEIAEKIGAKIFISAGANDLGKAVAFIKSLKGV